jgi:hypothetical protein
VSAGVLAAVVLAIRRPMIEAAERQAALTDATLLEQWCEPESLRQAAEFVAKTIKR